MLGLAVSRPARADKLDVRAKYEEGLVRAALSRHGLVVDPAPEGKTIEAIIIDASNVILRGELPLSNKIPWTWLNHLHMRTRDPVVQRELLFAAGEAYRADLVEESARNLRNLFILSVARIVAARGSSPDRVVILVMTKDQWSLRLNTDFVLDQARLDTLSFSFAEENVAGRNKRASIEFALDPGRYLLGVGYNDPRVWGSRVFAGATVDVYLNRLTNNAEGGYGALSIGSPLYSLHTEWAWDASFAFLQDKFRLFQGGDIAELKIGNELVPYIYARKRVSAVLEGIHSWGVVNKVNVTAGVRYDSNLYQLTDDIPASVSRGAREAFLGILPRTEDAAGPFVAFQYYRSDYIKLKDIDTFALTEDFRLGPLVNLSVRYAYPMFNIESNFVELNASYAHLHYFRGNLLGYSAGVSARIQEGVLPGTVLVNEEAAATLHEITPRFGPFRLHLAGAFRFRNHDLNHTVFVLGSSTRLRGYETQAFAGNSFYVTNVELRTVALNLWTLHVGAVLFYDGGGAPVTLAALSWHQDAGIGLRILIPQFNRGVLRLDLAFPFEVPSGGWVPRFSAEFGQAF